MRVRVGAATDIGRVREGNEDAYLLEQPLYAVADGMGGHRGGEVASSLALETIHRLFERREGSLAEQVGEANRAVFERSQLDRNVAGMGTTLTAALVEGDRVHLAHIGDSRAYLFRDGELRRLTEDHTLVHRMVQEGEITEEEAEVHPHRNILTRVVGVDPQVDVDESLVPIAVGDRILLCTDGLTGMVPEDQVRAIIEQSPDPQQAVELLVSAANRAGGVDNITAVILEFVDDASVGGGVAQATASVPTTTRPASPAPVSSAQSAGTVARTPVRQPRPWIPTPRLARPSVVRSVVALVVLMLALVGLRVYLDSQWFVGVSDGRVAIFRGVPTRIGGLELNSVVVETSIDAEDAKELALYRDLEEGITADDRGAAEAIVEQIRDDVARGATGAP